jgi:uncharacterized protein (DUF1697 family)
MNYMKKYVAFLRGINVGGNNKVSMAELKTVFDSLGFSRVTTYINSGNVIFEAAAPSVEAIERAMKKRFGFTVKCLLRDTAGLRRAAELIPAAWTNDNEQRTDVLLLWEDFDQKATLKLIKTNPAVDRLMYVPGAIVWNLKRSDYSKTGMRKFIGTDVYKNMTARNINTLRKLVSLAAA